MDAVAVNRSELCALLDNGTIVHFTKMFDAFGDETDSTTDAVSAIAQLPNGNWIVIYLESFESVSVH